MPKYEREPISAYGALVTHVGKTYPGTSIACDAAKTVIHIQNDDQTEAEFQMMMDELKSKFPGAF